MNREFRVNVSLSLEEIETLLATLRWRNRPTVPIALLTGQSHASNMNIGCCSEFKNKVRSLDGFVAVLNKVDCRSAVVIHRGIRKGREVPQAARTPLERINCSTRWRTTLSPKVRQIATVFFAGTTFP